MSDDRLSSLFWAFVQLAVGAVVIMSVVAVGSAVVENNSPRTAGACVEQGYTISRCIQHFGVDSVCPLLGFFPVKDLPVECLGYWSAAINYTT